MLYSFILAFAHPGKEIGGVCPVHVPHRGDVVPQIQNPEALMRVMVPASRVKPVMRVEPAKGRSVGPLKESKMPFTNHMSGISCKKKVIHKEK